MSKNALIVWGGWDGHQPQAVAEVFRAALSADGFSVEVSDTLDSLRDESKLMKLNLIVPIWTMGKIDIEPLTAVCNAVGNGVGMAGCHGGMCDAFRDSPEWQFMTGGQWVAHPGNETAIYAVNIKPNSHPIMEGINDFTVRSEQYYMHVDPAVKVLATTHFPTADGPHVPNGPIEMPVVWTKIYGKGRVFYSSIGHTPADVSAEPHLMILRRGCAGPPDEKGRRVGDSVNVDIYHSDFGLCIFFVISDFGFQISDLGCSAAGSTRFFMIVTIDGPAGTGKSTVALATADRLGFDFLDTGAMYRAIALEALRRNANLEDARELTFVAKHCRINFDWSKRPPGVKLNDEPVGHLLRGGDVTKAASSIAVAPAIREQLVAEQQRIGREHGKLVTEGRDQGSVVFPQAEWKFYLDAAPAERARRRVAQLRARGEIHDFQEILNQIIARDRRDANRAVGPMVIPAGATVIDTTSITQDQVVNIIVKSVEGSMSK